MRGLTGQITWFPHGNGEWPEIWPQRVSVVTPRFLPGNGPMELPCDGYTCGGQIAPICSKSKFQYSTLTRADIPSTHPPMMIDELTNRVKNSLRLDRAQSPGHQSNSSSGTPYPPEYPKRDPPGGPSKYPNGPAYDNSAHLYSQPASSSLTQPSTAYGGSEVSAGDARDQSRHLLDSPPVSHETIPTHPTDCSTASYQQVGAQFSPGAYPTPDLLLVPVGRYYVLSQPQGYTSSAIQRALDVLGEHATLYLSQGTRWAIGSTIYLKSHQELATWGYPTNEFSMAWLEAESTCEGHILQSFGTRGVRVRNLVIDGGREKFGYYRKCQAMVQFGGEGGQNQVLDRCIVRHPRQWSCFQAFEGGQNVRVTNNFFGPAGYDEQTAPGCHWADGISYAASNGLVAGNQILDATDGAIVVFGAPGTLVTSNTIITRTRIGLGGINMVDYGPHDGNYENTRVVYNTIRIEGSYLKIGIGQGTLVWGVPNEGSPKQVLRGATVVHNLIEANPNITSHSPGAIGYGFAVTQVENWTCADNISAPNVVYEGDMSEFSRASYAVNPGPFVKSRGLKQITITKRARTAPPPRGNRFQNEFVDGNILTPIRIRPGRSNALSFAPKQLYLKIDGPPIKLQNVELSLDPDGELRLQDVRTNNTLWSAGSREFVVGASNAALVLEPGGKLLIVEDSWRLFDLTPNLPPSGCENDENNDCKVPQLVISDVQPYLSLTSPIGSTILATSYREKENWTLQKGSYVSRQSWDGEHTLVSLASPRGQYMVLQTVQGREMTLPITWPVDPSRWKILWCSPNQPTNHDALPNVVFQGDGNFVIYDENWRPLWATGTCGREPPAKYIQWGDGSPSDPYFAVVDVAGNLMWSTGP